MVRVLDAPANSEFGVGDLVAGVVRRPDPDPCGACAAGEFDMCRNGRYLERTPKERSKAKPALDRSPLPS